MSVTIQLSVLFVLVLFVLVYAHACQCMFLCLGKLVSAKLVRIVVLLDKATNVLLLNLLIHPSLSLQTLYCG